MPTTVPHRELRNHSAELLRRAAAGESFEVTNNGRVVALLVPPPASPLEAHLRRRLMVPASAARLPRIPRVHSSVSTAEALAELKGDR
jgi:prevent-host-death family protein